MKQAGVYDYIKNNNKFNRDMSMLKKFMANRKEYLVETNKDKNSSTNIQTLINYGK